MPVFPKLKHLSAVQEKIKRGDAVKIGVFCSGNGDRSPLAHRVLQTTFNNLGYRNVEVFSFGTSVSPSSHHGAASSRTSAHAKEMGYDLSSHSRRHIGDDDVQADIKKADLLLAMSPSHLAMAVEYSADESPQIMPHLLGKTWTLKGFADRKEWTRGPRQVLGGIARRLSLRDPYFHDKTSEGERAFRKDLNAVEMTAKKAVRRLIGMKR